MTVPKEYDDVEKANGKYSKSNVLYANSQYL